jgi:hypothetical protein
MNVLLIIGVNLVGFVLGVDSTQYFVHELINSWTGTLCSRELLLPLLIETTMCRDSLPAWCLCMPVC